MRTGGCPLKAIKSLLKGYFACMRTSPDCLLHDCLSAGRRLAQATSPLLANSALLEASPPHFSGCFIRLKRRKPNSSRQPLQDRAFRIKASKEKEGVREEEAKWQGILVYVGSMWKRNELKGLHLQARACSSEATASKMEDQLSQRSRRKKKHSPESEMSRELDMCSKRGDLNCALAIFDKVTQEGVLKLRQQNYNVLLYLCSAAATGALKPGNDGCLSDSLSDQTCSLDNTVHINSGANSSDTQSELLAANEIRQSGIMDTKARDSALRRGFEIYDQMQREGVPWNEATLTAVARLAVAKGDGDMAFEMVKRMAAASIAPRLRSYGPALYTYCRNNELEKAFEVDAHMLASGVRPEESELAALLKVSVDAGREDKVYLVLHRLRTTVRELSPSTVEIVEHWFKSEPASRAGEQSWENQPTIGEIKESIEAKGGGWHGLGWLGKGKWDVERTNIDKNGSCLCCGEPLCTIDIDPLETEDFAKSVAELACEREVEPNKFKAFQSWLDKQLPYEAVVDGANVGLYQQNFAEGGFNFHQLRAVITAIQARSPNKRLPLVILHKRRTQGRAASSPTGKELLKKLMEADSLYASPLGSNDDWYWLYAAVKCKCLLVTNDEMRDHLFQLLGNDFFPKWKERHQVRFSFKRLSNMELHMPPPYSIVIQESSNGSWHVPQSGGDNIEVPREWLCIRRKPGKNTVTSANIEPVLKKQCSLPSSERDCKQLSPSINLPNSFEVGKNFQVRQVSSLPSEILLKLEAAEKIADSPIDFQI